jgi:hypothetical protein
MKWFIQWWESFRSWLRANKAAHEQAAPHGCCSSPPAGAGHHDDKGA